MSFQTTVNQQQTAVDMAAAARSLAPEVTTAFGLLMARFLQNGEVLPDLQLLQEILSRWLSDSGRQVLAIDDRYSAQLRLQQGQIAQRDQLAADLRLRLRDVRFLLDRHFGEERSRGLFPERNLTRLKLASLIRVGRQAIEVLKDPGLAWQQLAPTGLLASPEALAGALTVECDQLELLLDDVIKDHKRQRIQRLGEKVAEVKATREAARRGAKFLSGLYELVGFEFQAKRLRLRRRRPGKMDESSQGEPPPPASAKPMDDVLSVPGGTEPGLA